MNGHTRWNEKNALPGWRSFITPNDRVMIAALQQIHQGERTIYVDDPDDHDAEITAREMCRFMRTNFWCREGYIEVDTPMKVESENHVYFIGLYLDQRGRDALEAVHENNLVWSSDRHAICQASSTDFWNVKLRWGNVGDDVFERVRTFTHPILTSVVRNYAIYKLIAERRDNGCWCASVSDVKNVLGHIFPHA